MGGTHAKSVLVTGGFGFIGSHLVEMLTKKQDLNVHVVDSMVTSPIHLPAYLEQLGSSDRVSYDLCTVKEFFSRKDLPVFDEVYHLASVVGPVGVLKHGGRILQSTVDDGYAIADYCLRVKAKLCDVSTSEVYGGGRDGYCSEKDSMIIPPKVSVRLEYAVAKLGCEVALMNMSKVTELDAKIVRPFNVAGPRQSPIGGFVLPRFIKQALAGEPITVYGDGIMIRAFTHVRDVADGIMRAMCCGRRGSAYNIGNPANKITILELAKKVIEITGSRSEISFVDPKALWGPLFEEANDKYPDADRAISELGWQPQYDLQSTMLETVEYIRAGRVN
jgi:UDP-glucose 4-epimerase